MVKVERCARCHWMRNEKTQMLIKQWCLWLVCAARIVNFKQKCWFFAYNLGVSDSEVLKVVSVDGCGIDESVNVWNV